MARPQPVLRGRVPAARAADAPVGSQLDAGFGYQGGPIIQSPDVYVSFWGSSWTQAANATAKSNLIQFVSDFLASNYMNILSQYSVGQGAGKCGAYRGESERTTVSGDIAESDIANNLQALINAGAIPEPGNPSSTSVLVFLDENIRVNDSGADIVMCEPNGDNAFGFHYFFTTSKGHKCYYSVIPALNDACLKNSCSNDGNCSLHLAETQEQRRTQVASHEFSEMVTDPEISAWRDPGNGSENGDNCNGNSGTITVSSRTWTVQQMYSRADDAAGGAACILAPATPIPPIGIPTGPRAQGDSMQPGQVLNPGDFLTSSGGRYKFIYQLDGNLVLYDGGAPLWASGTNGRGFGVCIMQSDGNLVLYIGGPYAVWASGTNGNAGSHFIIQDDGNGVIYRSNGTPAWATNTNLPAGPVAHGDTMQPGQVLNPGQAIASSDGRYRFIYQTDGNLVLYDGGTALWASATNGKGVGVCIMQADGNLVIYLRGGHPIWASGTNGSPGSHLLVQIDGNVVIYRPDNHPIWSTNTYLPLGPAAQGDTMQPGQVLTPNHEIVSAGGRYRFIYQGDGNLVLYDGGAALWASATNGKGVGVCIMQADGNLVIYLRGGHAIWASGTNGSPGAHLIMQVDGNAVIYRTNGSAAWATNTYLPLGPTARGDTMQPGQVLNPNQQIVSAGGRYRFIYQGDGNLVLYDGNAALWASATNGKGVGVCIMQTDGNLVIYLRGGHPIWASGTNGSPGAHLIMQVDGNAVIYRTNGSAAWATNTYLPAGPTAQGDTMQPGQSLNPGQSIISADRRFTFVYQGDGNLVLYRGGAPLWASGTNGKGVGVCIMQTDGNLVIYLRGGHPIWASGTNGSPGSRLVAQSDGNVVIYRPDNHPIWATNTVQH